MLRILKSKSSLPWFCTGDFNEILSDEEKMGGAPRLARQMERFRESLIDCGLHALQVSGAKFTWSRGKSSNMILERLDRGLATDKWFDLFPFSMEKHLVASVSDHVPLLFLINEQKTISN